MHTHTSFHFEGVQIHKTVFNLFNTESQVLAEINMTNKELFVVQCTFVFFMSHLLYIKEISNSHILYVLAVYLIG